MPAALAAAADLTLIAIALLAFATLQGYRFSVRPIIVGLAAIIRAFAVSLPLVGRVGPGPWMADQLHNLDRLIQSSLHFAISLTEAGAVGLFNGSAAMMKWLASEIADLGTDTLHAFQTQAAHTGAVTLKAVNRLIHSEVGAVQRQLTRTFGIEIHGLAVRVTHLGSQAIALEHDLAHWRGFTAKQLRAALRQLSRLGWIGQVASIAALGTLILRKLHLSWLRHHTGAASLVALGLAKLGLSWARCSNVGKVGKALCGTPAGLVEELLGDALDVLVVADICLIAKVIEEAALAFEPALEELVALENFVCLGAGGSLPSGV